MKWTDLDENWCPVARTLSLVGDRWTLLILRDCFLGRSKFEEFAESTGATRHIVAGRLKRLVEAGILARELYNERPKRYRYVLTDKGKELGPALATFRDWGKTHLPVRRIASSAESATG
ncbi:winged helix-turn-helix transcriptional regulator [Henriciella litoralis]|uniref:winged helix-turn-helix transcriptional regulator n=1 Tax=Henriciella litoralis TaxID=568102 RepID=UPI000A047E31|nr:helix-turn-helix domain-containing protein [Henriciella litoralis]